MNLGSRLTFARLLAAALALLAVLWLAQPLAPAVDVIERAWSDFGWKVASAGPGAAERRVVVVDIDERSLQQVGPWPWPRETIEQLSRRVAAAGAAVQVFDMVLPEAKPDDAGLAAAWKEGRVVAGQILSVDPQVQSAVGVVGGATGACPPFAAPVHGYVANAEVLTRSGVTIGHLTPSIEADGIVRKVPAFVCLQGRAYPSLALAALWRLSQPEGALVAGATPDWTVVRAADPLVGLWSPPIRLSSASLPGVTVPLESNGDLRVPYRAGRSRLAAVSAADLLAGGESRGLLDGAVVLIGSTAFGLSDAVATPLASMSSGVEVHAESLVGLLDQRVPYVPRGANAIQWTVGVAFLLVLVLLCGPQGRPPIKRLPVAGIALAALAPLVALWAQSQLDLVVPWVAASSVALIGAMTLTAVEHMSTQAQRERLTAHLEAYLPAPVARRLARMAPAGVVQAERREITALAMDIRNFAAFAAHRSPEETSELLHRFTCAVVEVIERHGGVVEAIVADSVTAVWNGYSACADHPTKALDAARELVRGTVALLEPRHPVRDSDPVQPLALGIGLETGVALVGSFGPQRRRAWAALGEPVAVARRLRQMTQDLSFPILLGPQLRARLPGASAESLGEFLLEGLSRHYAVFVPVGWSALVSGQSGWASSSHPLSDPDPWSSAQISNVPGASPSVAPGSAA